MAAPAYPIGLDVDGAAPQNRLSVLLRILYVIPHIIILYFLNLAVGIVTFIAWFAILFTGKYPQGLLQFSVNANHWMTRANGYMYLLTDKYPPFAMGPDDAYPVRFLGTGQVEGRNRLTTFFRYIMLIPHIIVIYFLALVASVVLLIAWFAALFTGTVPPGMHNFLAGFLRWMTRLTAYASLLTDEYPPFSLS
jgi:uncharacterized membrane protein YhdT